MKTSLFRYILFLSLCLILICCATRSNKSNGNIIWHDAKSLDELIGKWEGHTVMSVDEKNISINFNMKLEYYKNSESINLVSKMDMNNYLNDLADNTGISKNVIWEMIVEGLKDTDITTDENYNVYFYTFWKIETFSLDSKKRKILINEYGDRMRLIFLEPFRNKFAKDLNEILLRKSKNIE